MTDSVTMQPLTSFRKGVRAALVAAMAVGSTLVPPVSPSRAADQLWEVEQTVLEQLKGIFPYLREERAPDGNYFLLRDMDEQRIAQLVLGFTQPVQFYVEQVPQQRSNVLIASAPVPEENRRIAQTLADHCYDARAVLRRGDDERTIPLEVLINSTPQHLDVIWALYSPPNMTLPYAHEIQEAVRRYVPESEWIPVQNWIQAKAGVESANNPRAISPKGARGFLQVLPATAADEDRLGGRPVRSLQYYRRMLHNPEFAADISLRYFERNRKYVERTLGKHWLDPEVLPKMAAVYNAGLGATLSGAYQRFRETRDYIQRMITTVVANASAQETAMARWVGAAPAELEDTKSFSNPSPYRTQ